MLGGVFVWHVSLFVGNFCLCMGLKRERKVGHESAVCCATSATARAVVPSPSTGSGPGGFPWVSPFATVPFWGYNWSYGALFL